MAKKSSKSAKSDDRSHNGIVYREFGQTITGAALERGTPDLPPAQQNLRVSVERKGRGGKTVSIVSGFQSKPETLTQILKQLKAQCGSGGTLKEVTIEIQGDHRVKIIQWLSQQGYKVKASGG